MEWTCRNKQARLRDLAEWHCFFAIWPRRVSPYKLVTGKVMRRLGSTSDSYLKTRKYQYCSMENFIFAKTRGDEWTSRTYSEEFMAHHGDLTTGTEKFYTFNQFQRWIIINKGEI